MKEFCPPGCDTLCVGKSPFEDGGVKDRCWHLDDKLLDNPIDIELPWGIDEWQQTQIVAENGNQYITTEGHYLDKNSPLIRRV